MKITRSMAIGFAAVAILAAATGNRKVTNNAQSPSADTSVKLKGREITIEYNAPSARGRKVEGGLIPYGQWYRMGADSATTLTTEADVTIGSLQVPKGAHTLYLLASENGDWKLIVNNQTGQWGTVYDESKDLGRTSMKVTKLSSPVDTFKITLTSVEPDQAALSVEWGTTKASVPVKLR